MNRKAISIIAICLIILTLLLCGVIIDFNGSGKPVFSEQEIEIESPETEIDASGYWTSYYAVPSGSGTEEDPYLIASAENLAWMSYKSQTAKLKGVYKQTNNIDLSAHLWKPIGRDDTSQGWFFFSGEYDGCGYYIKGITYPSTTSYTTFESLCGESFGLFGFLTGTVRNVRILSIIENGPCYARQLGSIAGLNWGTINNCVSFASLYQKWNGYYSCHLGGIAGVNSSNGNIINCYYYGNLLKAEDIGTSVQFECGVGGIVGGNDVSISNCYAKCNINAKSKIRELYVGGIAGNGYSFAGYVSGDIVSCKFEGKISITENDNDYSAICFWGGIVGCGYYTDYLNIMNCHVKLEVNDYIYNSNNKGLSGYQATKNISSCIFEIKGKSDSSFIKNYLMQQSTTDYAEWIKTFDGRLLPSGLSWLATGGIKLSGIEEVEEMGYTAV